MSTTVARLKGPRGKVYAFSADDVEALRAQLTPTEQALAARAPAELAGQDVRAELPCGQKRLTLDGGDLATLFLQVQHLAPAGGLPVEVDSTPTGPLTRIHVNQHVIKRNAKSGARDPVLTVKRGRDNRYAHEVRVLGPSSVVYSPDKPLPCGARVWIETHAPVELDKERR